MNDHGSITSERRVRRLVQKQGCMLKKIRVREPVQPRLRWLYERRSDEHCSRDKPYAAYLPYEPRPGRGLALTAREGTLIPRKKTKREIPAEQVVGTPSAGSAIRHFAIRL